MVHVTRLMIISRCALKCHMMRECQNKGLLPDISLIDSFSLPVFLSQLEGIKPYAWLPGEGRIGVLFLKVDCRSLILQRTHRNLVCGKG